MKKWLTLMGILWMGYVSAGPSCDLHETNRCCRISLEGISGANFDWHPERVQDVNIEFMHKKPVPDCQMLGCGHRVVYSICYRGAFERKTITVKFKYANEQVTAHQEVVELHIHEPEYQ